jgi:hypothetical protein
MWKHPLFRDKSLKVWGLIEAYIVRNALRAVTPTVLGTS